MIKIKIMCNFDGFGILEGKGIFGRCLFERFLFEFMERRMNRVLFLFIVFF